MKKCLRAIAITEQLPCPRVLLGQTNLRACLRVRSDPTKPESKVKHGKPKLPIQNHFALDERMNVDQSQALFLELWHLYAVHNFFRNIREVTILL